LSSTFYEKIQLFLTIKDTGTKTEIRVQAHDFIQSSCEIVTLIEDQQNGEITKALPADSHVIFLLPECVMHDHPG